MKRIAPVVLGLAALIAVPAVAFAGPGQGDGRKPAAARDGAGRLRQGPGARRLAKFRHRAHKVLKALDLTEEQKAALKASREAAAPVREDLKAKIQAIVAAARQGERTPEARKAAREQIKAAIEGARSAVEPSASRFVGSLSAEQKAKLAEKAKAHGKTFEEAKLVKLVEGVLIAPKGHRHGRR
ncbi:MAG: Spy/CpxP family protein refolding chaperone [Planctomycetia bacterium]|nr:Spy/CpxP family protein refolding chaperone [Planctomycetia bacterium]